MLNEARRKLLDTVRNSDYIASFADPGREVVGIDTYTFSIDQNDTATTAITSAAGMSFDLVMNTDSDFILCAYSGYGRLAGATSLIQNPALLLQITDKSSGRTFFNAPSPMALIAGQGGFPFLVPSPRVIRPRSTLQVDVTAARAGVTFDGFFFSMHGGRIFYRT